MLKEVNVESDWRYGVVKLDGFFWDRYYAQRGNTNQ